MPRRRVEPLIFAGDPKAQRARMPPFRPAILHRIRILLRLPLRTLALLVEAVVCLGFSRLTVRCLPFRWIAHILGTAVSVREIPKESPTEAPDRIAHRIGKAIRVVARHTPGDSTCLAQAVAAHTMLRRRGKNSVLLLGATRDEGMLQFHAWVKAGAFVVAGDGDLGRYTIISAFVIPAQSPVVESNRHG